jgi:hypothetical protein
MQETFFDTPNPSADAENRLRVAMEAQWRQDLDDIRDQRRIPDWIGEPKPLSKDRAAILQMLYNRGSVIWTKTPSKANRDIARAIGYKDRSRGDDFDLFGGKDQVDIIVIAKSAFDGMVKAKLICARPVSNGIEYAMTDEGEYALEDWQIERELGFV